MLATLIYNVGVTLREMYIPINRRIIRAARIVPPRWRLLAQVDLLSFSLSLSLHFFFIRRGIARDINCERC